MTALTIAAVEITEDADPESPATAADLYDCCRLEEAHHLALWGNVDRCAPFGEALNYWKGDSYQERLLFLARLDGVPVGSCSVELPIKDNVDTAWIDVLVSAGHRRQGIGRRLLEKAEQTARERGRKVLQVYCEEPAGMASGEMLPAKSGTGGMPWALPSTMFATDAGYSLEQVETSSRLALPVPEGLLSRLEAEALEHSTGYSLVGWAGRCPEDYVNSYAILRSRMSTDAPTAGLDVGPEYWDEARVREEEETLSKGGVELLVSAAMHHNSGELAAFTGLSYRKARPHVIIQEDTLVAPAHRGHRLGMLVKVANTRRAQAAWPTARSVITWNASENHHMLAINRSLGFRPSGFEGEWQKRLDDPLDGK